MRMTKRWISLLLILTALLESAFTRDSSLSEGANLPPGPDRYTTITVDYTAYTWWLALWKGQEIVCELEIDHQGQPTPGEVYRQCGQSVYDKWIGQQPCLNPNGNTCEGYYVFPAGSRAAQKEIPVTLPAATAWLTLGNCEPVPSESTNICESAPELVIAGQEPLPGYAITKVEGTYNGEPFSCDDTRCTIKLGATSSDQGVKLEFWAWSSYGDTSPVFTAQVRVSQSDQGDPDQLYWYTDVLSSQWQGQPTATCADAWESFPPVGGPPEWLTTPGKSEELSSDIPYTYLAANLILQGAVDASACVDGGLASGSEVNQCGLDAARPAVNDWQNRFDDLILSTADTTSVPARLLKNLFARRRG